MKSSPHRSLWVRTARNVAAGFAIGSLAAAMLMADIAWAVDKSPRKEKVPPPKPDGGRGETPPCGLVNRSHGNTYYCVDHKGNYWTCEKVGDTWQNCENHGKMPRP